MNDKEVRIPVVSHHCRITHSACDCVLRRLKKLEAVAEAARLAVDQYQSKESQDSRLYHLMLVLAALEEKP